MRDDRAMMLRLATRGEDVVAQPYGALDKDSERDFFGALAPFESGAATQLTLDLRRLTKLDDEAAFVVSKIVTRLRQAGVSVTVIDHDGRWTYKASV
jgi:hypothetical protein